MMSTEAALERLRDPAAEVSAHYLIGEDGRIWRLVPETARAWHAGAGRWGRTDDVNSRSIGIELANPGPLLDFPPFPEPQMAALEGLLGQIMMRWKIAPEGVIAHSDMAPGRKADPGPKFDWRRLARQGLASWPEADCTESEAVPDWEAFRQTAARIGYAMPEDGGWETVLAAFRLRFMPGAKGPLTRLDLAKAAAIAAAVGKA